jgi:carbon-monoxide dehydrogenase small subunit
MSDARSGIGSDTLIIETIVNGEPIRRLVDARQHLGDFLRIDLELTGLHLGCEHGVCGACTILLDSHTARSCLTLAAQAHGKRVDTVEGMTESGALDDLRAAFITHNAAQCAFCSSGMLLAAHELVQSGEMLTRDEIRTWLSGNICRCTGYHAIIDAVESVLRAKSGAA